MWCSAPKAFSRKKEAEQDAAKQALHFENVLVEEWLAAAFSMIHSE